ncbi:MAG TPA: MFS transporter [Pirellulales bacterium]
MTENLAQTSSDKQGEQRGPSPLLPRPKLLQLSLLFAALYFIQGATEPTDGLTAQPLMSWLRRSGQTASQIASLGALLWIPWAIKPLYGVLSDFFPLAGYHRKSYLIAATGITSASLALVFALQPAAGSVHLAVLLFAATLGVALSDVVVDAIIVEKGQPAGLTGRFQAIGWASLYAAAICTGTLGGWISESAREELSFLVCSALALVSLLLALCFISERRATATRGELRETLLVWRDSIRSPYLFIAGAFLFCLNFNPFSAITFYLYTTEELGLSEQFFGDLQSIDAVGALCGCLLYAWYCRRLAPRSLVLGSIALSVASTLAYWALRDATTARAVVAFSGFALATATVIQLDLAARICPPRVAGTLFAILMALGNLGTMLSRWLGGMLYEQWQEPLGSYGAFNLLVGLGGLTSALCVFFVPQLTAALSRQHLPSNRTA